MPMEKNFFFRVDSGASIGMGHFYRCLSLALVLQQKHQVCFFLNTGGEQEKKILERYGITSTFVSRENEVDFLNQLAGKETVILDGYNFDRDFQLAIKNKNSKLIFIDDMAAFEQVADIVVNHAYNAAALNYKTIPTTRLLLGIDYVLLRPFFTEAHQRALPVFPPEKFLISMGGADEGNLTLKYIEFCLRRPQVQQVNVVLGALYPHQHSLEKHRTDTRVQLFHNLSEQEMGYLMLEADLVICPASGTLLEALALGSFCASGYSANNQMAIYKGLSAQKAILDLGDLNQTDLNTFENILQETSPEQASVIRENAMALIDRKSVERVVAEIEKIS